MSEGGKNVVPYIGGLEWDHVPSIRRYITNAASFVLPSYCGPLDFLDTQALGLEYREPCGLLQRDFLAPIRLVSNVLTNVSNLVKRNAKSLIPGSRDPEWVSKWKERDRKLQKLMNGSIPLSRESKTVGVLS